jgi:hypothetical protein
MTRSPCELPIQRFNSGKYALSAGLARTLALRRVHPAQHVETPIQVWLLIERHTKWKLVVACLRNLSM